MQSKPNWSEWKFQKPEKKIETATDFEKWKTSKAYQIFTTFINDLNDAVKGIPNSAPCEISAVILYHFISNFQTTTNILQLLDTLSVWINEIPPTTQETRYGNKSFRTFYTKVENVLRCVDLYLLLRNPKI